MSTPFFTPQPSQTQPDKQKKSKSAMSNNNLTILRRYAGCPNPSDVLPKSVLFAETNNTLTVFDAFPKSMFHFLVLPKSQPAPEDEENEASQPTLFQFVNSAKLHKSKYSNKSTQDLPTAHQLRNLPTMLSNLPKTRSKEILQNMEAAALDAKKEIEEEMIRLHGWKWEVWIGFHAVPSMEHLHLHVISADLISERLKNKKHYNTFHPKLGFFIPVNDVLEWFDAAEGYLETQIRSLASLRHILKQDLVCFHCEQVMSNMPMLKKHLQDEWNKLDKRKKAGQARMAMFAAAAEKKRLKLEAEESKKRKSSDIEELVTEADQASSDHVSHHDKRRRAEEAE